MGTKRQPQSSVKETWNRLEDWFRTNAPESVGLFPPGASEGEIQKAETEIGIKFPDDIRACYRIHNGTNRIWICDYGYLMPLYSSDPLPKKVVRSWVRRKEMLENGLFSDPGFVSKPRGPIRVDWWNTNWIPITSNESGDSVCLDLSPAKGGVLGQMIEWWHEKGAVSVIASSFSQWFAYLANEFQAGRFRFLSDTKELERI